MVVLAALSYGGWYAWQKWVKPKAGVDESSSAKVIPLPPRVPFNDGEGNRYEVDPKEFAPGGFLRIAESSADTGGFYFLSIDEQKAWLKNKGYRQLA